MQQHSQHGADVLQYSQRPLMRMAAEIALSHHERWDGTGYPSGISGTVIPISARIVALADVFDSLGSNLVYREAWAPDAVAGAIREGSGKQFDPNLADLLLANLDAFNALRQKFPDDANTASSS